MSFKFDPGLVALTPNPFPSPRPPLPIPLPPKFEWPPRLWIPDPVRLVYPPAKIKILVVTDTLSFSTATGAFAIGRFVEVLRDATHPDHPDYAVFDVDTMSRAANNTSFFTDALLDDYDEVWLFGFGRGSRGDSGAHEHDLSSSEVAALTRFMDAGGGVFATGDHEDLGLGLAAGVPRVKSMRRWYHSYQGTVPLPPGENDAPDNARLDRIDTVEPTTADPDSGAQSDATPQVIEPKQYRGPTIFHSYVHPVLCGPRGPITLFPDHAHEGICEVPDAWNASDFPGVRPEVIAWGTTSAGQTKFEAGVGYTLPSSERFGLLSAYDGHRGSRGRVLTDSTWHHWMNINIDGFIAAAAAGSPDAWLDVAAYFRNVAVWLAPKGKQRAMRRAGTAIIRWRYPFIENVPFDLDLNARLPMLLPSAADAAGKAAPQCQRLLFVRDWLIDAKFDRLATLFDPWHPEGEKLELDPMHARALIETVSNAVLGGAAVAAGQVFQRADGKSAVAEEADAKMIEAVSIATKAALRAHHKQAERACAELKAFF